MSEKKSSGKKRNWVCCVYPDSAPEDWRGILQRTGLQCAISPLHDKDINPDGTPKKAHWHVMLCYQGPTAYEPVKRVSDSLNAPAPQPVEQIKGYYRYLTHKDNPEKAQYYEGDIEHINGFNIRDHSELTKSEVFALKMGIIDYVEAHDIREYQELLLGLKTDDLLDMCEVAATNTIFADAYVRSRRNKLERLERDECVK